MKKSKGVSDSKEEKYFISNFSSKRNFSSLWSKKLRNHIHVFPKSLHFILKICQYLFGIYLMSIMGYCAKYELEGMGGERKNKRIHNLLTTTYILNVSLF